MRREFTTVKAVCPHDCPDTCGMVVTVIRATGRAVELRGDTDHPFTRGFLCQKVATTSTASTTRTGCCTR